ncbi:MAG TPA: peptidoglycan DD-metalloendopeptidase family protein [Spirillospora sp.]|nr:peptidoglycan DD-metalloendopeptidase family protein [Spirillospora sp.]
MTINSLLKFTAAALYLLLAACRPTEQRTPFAVTIAPSEIVPVAQRALTSVPTADLSTLTPTPTATPTSTPTPTATPTATPSLTLTPTVTFTPSATVELGSLPTENGEIEAPPTWTPPPDNPAVQIDDHYHLRRPIADGGVNWVDRTYPYGGTAGGRLQVHHGVEFVNPRGTPVLAAAAGTVVHAGNDSSSQYGPYTSYYGNLVVIQHDFVSPEGLPVFTLYGHMDRVEVETGQRVEPGVPIGRVGDSGIAQGPHLHFEVRVGNAFDFGATRNPELWIFPFFRFGTLAGRVMDANGSLLRDVTVQVRSTDIQRYAFTYAGDTVNSDPEFGENFTLGDLPANYYEVSVTDNGRVRFRETIYVYPNRTTWIEVKLRP